MFFRSKLVFACDFSEKFGDKVNEEGVTMKPEVVLPPFAAVAYKAFGDVWIRPGTSDSQMIEMREKSASSWVETLDFTHNDLNFFMSHKNYGRRGLTSKMLTLSLRQ